jgi:hypothetical protein
MKCVGPIMSALDESASAIVEILTRLDTRLSAMEAKIDAVLAGLSQPDGAQPRPATTLYDRRKANVSFDGIDRRMGEI